METPAHHLRLSLPNGETASFQEMQAYGQAIQAFVEETEATLGAIEDVAEYNRRVDYLHLLAESYNAQLRVFKSAEKARLRMQLAALMVAAGQAS